MVGGCLKFPILLPGGNAAPDVTLGFIHFQHSLDLHIQGAVKLGQPL